MNPPPIIAKNYLEAGVKKVNLPTSKAFVLAMYAGMFIASGGIISSVAGYGESGGHGRVLSGGLFPIGLMLVLCAGAELFTGNCLLVIPLLEKKINFCQMLKSWGIVYLGNLVGSIFFAILVCYSHAFSLFDEGLAQAVVGTATKKCNLHWGRALLLGLLCNFFVCLSVWLSFAAQQLSSKIIGLWTPILLFVACGFEHSVANMYFIPAGLFASYEYHIDREKLDWWRFIWRNLIPVSLGNILGGSVFVGVGYWYVYLYDQKNEEETNNISVPKLEIPQKTLNINCNDTTEINENKKEN